jgi:hypothetical protein
MLGMAPPAVTRDDFDLRSIHNNPGKTRDGATKVLSKRFLNRLKKEKS